jgi:AraC family transcriptional regulator of adaptative response / DNA-3-methyladenine glycosylase II
MVLDREVCYRALCARDPRFDGRFYTGVKTTRIYCRPVCPAPAPRLEHCVFLASPAAAHEAGFRPCLRCRPELTPGPSGWWGMSPVVQQALGMIAGGDSDGCRLSQVETRLGVSGRHLRRLFIRHLGAAPVAVAQAHRLLFAKQLITDTAMPMADVAFASGFGSVRRFNAVVRRTYDRSPRELRQAAGRQADGDQGDSGAAGISLRLPYRPPYDWDSVIAFLAPRAIPGVESADRRAYRRTFSLDGARGALAVSPAAGHHLAATIWINRITALPGVVARLRRVFDLDADATAIEHHLSRDRRLAPLLAARTGLRVPGAWDAFETAVRAVLGQQISVAAATTLAGRLASAYGEQAARDRAARALGLSVRFPAPRALAGADLRQVGLPRARAAALSSLAATVARDRSVLSPRGDTRSAVEQLTALPGIGPWTAEYIAMRVLRDPDAFPASDLGLLRAVQIAGRRATPRELIEIADAWRPWRAYAAMHLWMKG